MLEIKEQTGVVAPDLLHLPRCPRGMEYLWKWFLALHGKRQAGMSANAISWSDMHSYFRLMNLRPTRWDLDAISRLDDAYLESRNSEANGVAATASAVSAIASKNRRKT